MRLQEALDPATRAAVAAGRRARRRIFAIEQGYVADHIRDLRLARADLLDALLRGTGTEFGEANALTLLQAADRALAPLVEGSLPRGRAAARDAVEAAAESGVVAALPADLAGRSALALEAQVNLAALSVLHGDLIGSRIALGSEELRTGIRNVLRQTATGALTQPEALEKIGSAVGRSRGGLFGGAAASAERIFRTEMGQTFELARDTEREVLVKTGARVEKRWVAVKDERTRPEHLELDGVQIPYDENFDVGGFPAAFPLDPALPAKHRIHCRCTAVSVVAVPEKVDRGGQGGTPRVSVVVA